MHLHFFAALRSSTINRWLLAPLIALLVVLSACGGSGDSSKPPDQARATVLVYMVGSDLEDKHDLASGNLQEMMQVGSSPDVNIIVETGGANKDGWRTVKRQKVNQGAMELLTDVGPQNMIEPDNLRKFIEWGVEAYPAESYHLLFWDHGGGPLGGFGIDTNYNRYETMTIPQLVGALKDAHSTTGVSFDLIGFDACLMASAEVAHMLSPYGKYLVASQDIEPGGGWDWEPYLAHVRNEPAGTAESAGRTIIDAYIAKMQKSGSDYITLSLIDLSKMDALMKNLEAIALAIDGELDTPDLAKQRQAWLSLAYARRTTHDFQTSWIFGDTYDLVDIGDFIEKPALRGLNVTEEQMQAAKNALEDAVVYNRYGNVLWSASGLTLYVPLTSMKPDSEPSYTVHDTLDVPDGLKTLVKRYAQITHSDTLPEPSLGPIAWSGSDIYYAQQHNAEYSATEFAQLLENSNSSQPSHLAIKPLDAYMPSAEGTFNVAATANDWFRLPSAEGPPVLISLLPDDVQRLAVGYAMYMAPVWVRDTTQPGYEGSPGVLQVEYNDDGAGNKSYRVVGFIAHQTGSPAASRPDSKDMEPGSELYPLILSDDGLYGDWTLDLSRKIVSLPVGDDDTPRSDWWELETVSSSELCNTSCLYSFGFVDYQGSLNVSGR